MSEWQIAWEYEDNIFFGEAKDNEELKEKITMLIDGDVTQITVVAEHD